MDSQDNDEEHDSEDDEIEALYNKNRRRDDKASLLAQQRTVLELLHDGETIAKALTRLSGRGSSGLGKGVSKASKQLGAKGISEADPASFAKLSEAVALCVELGYGDIYIVTRAKLQEAVEAAERMESAHSHWHCSFAESYIPMCGYRCTNDGHRRYGRGSQVGVQAQA